MLMHMLEVMHVKKGDPISLVICLQTGLRKSMGLSLQDHGFIHWDFTIKKVFTLMATNARMLCNC